MNQKYGEAATRVAQGAPSSCCGGGAANAGRGDPITSDLYGAEETRGVPEQALAASLGCGNPTALAELRLGETVLDLGSGGGIDVLLSARRIGPTGTAFGLDITAPMLALALENKRKSGLANVHFESATIEITRVYRADDAKELLAAQGEDAARVAADVDGKFASAFVRAVKPAAVERAPAKADAAARSPSACTPTCCGR